MDKEYGGRGIASMLVQQSCNVARKELLLAGIMGKQKEEKPSYQDRNGFPELRKMYQARFSLM